MRSPRLSIFFVFIANSNQYCYATCNQGEQLVFQCNLTERNHKIELNVCASEDISPGKRTIVFRLSGEKVNSLEVRGSLAADDATPPLSYMYVDSAKESVSSLSVRGTDSQIHSVFYTRSALGFNGAGLINRESNGKRKVMRCDVKSIRTSDDFKRGISSYYLVPLKINERKGEIDYLDTNGELQSN